MLALLEEGLAPEAALERRSRTIRRARSRQLGVVAADGRVGVAHRSECLAWAGHRIGDGYAVQGNILAGEAVVAEMERAFLETAAARSPSGWSRRSRRPGGRRRLARAAVGGDRRRARRAPRPSRARGIDRVCELRVEDHREPIAELRRLLGIHLVWDALRRASRFHAPGSTREGVALLREALGRSGDDAVLLYDLACFESLAGETEAAFAHLARALELDPGLRPGAAPTRTSTRSGRTRASRRSSARLACGLDLYEYQGKELFRRAGIPVSDGRLATTPEEARAAAEELGGQVVVKAQVLTGGRGKAGGIKLAEGPDEAEARARGDPRPRHPRPRRPQALDREGLGDREGVLPLGHVRPRREAAAVHVHDAGRGGHRGGRGVDARRRSSGCTSIRSRASSPGRRGG